MISTLVLIGSLWINPIYINWVHPYDKGCHIHMFAQHVAAVNVPCKQVIDILREYVK